MSELDPSMSVDDVAATHVVAPMTRKERRALEQARALAASSQTTVRVEDGSAPVPRTRKAMRDSANSVARSLTVTRAEEHVPSEHNGTSGTTAKTEIPAVKDSVKVAPLATAEVFVPYAVSDDPELRAVARAALKSEGQRILPRALAPEEQAKLLLGDEAAVLEAAPLRDNLAGTNDEVATTTDEIDLSALLADAEADSDGDAADDVARDADVAKAQPKGTALYGQVDDVVASVLGAAALDEEHVEQTSVRRPLDGASQAAHRPLRARKAVSLRSTEAQLTPRRKFKRSRSVVQRFMAGGAILFIGGLVAVTSLPAEAFTGLTSPTSSAMLPTQGLSRAEIAQRVQVDESAHGAEEASFYLGNDDLTVNDALASARLSPDELASIQAVANTEQPGNYYTGTSAMPNTWALLETDYTQSPFPSLDTVPISSGFGYRWGSFHGGVDMIPGAGTPIFPVANGVVTAVFQGNHPGGGGYMVIVEHNVNGEFFQSWYPHMQAGSIQVEVGQVVDISTQLGAVGSTGNSTGAHLHLEIKNSDYVSFDPLVWLQTREEVLESGF